jgi:hypothetical protein
LRHYFASLLIADGADVKTVQARLRHASAKTDTYGHIWPDRDESTRAAVDAVLTAYRRNSGGTAGIPALKQQVRAGKTVTRRSTARTSGGDLGTCGDGWDFTARWFVSLWRC